MNVLGMRLQSAPPQLYNTDFIIPSSAPKGKKYLGQFNLITHIASRGGDALPVPLPHGERVFYYKL